MAQDQNNQKMYPEFLFFSYISVGTASIVSKHAKENSKQMAVAVAASKFNGIAEIIEAESSPSMSNQFMMNYIKIKKLEKALSRHQQNIPSWLQRVTTDHTKGKTTNKNKQSKLIIDYVKTVKEAKQSLKTEESTEASKKWRKYISDRMNQKKLNIMLYHLTQKSSNANKKHVSSHHIHK